MKERTQWDEYVTKGNLEKSKWRELLLVDVRTRKRMYYEDGVVEYFL